MSLLIWKATYENIYTTKIIGKIGRKKRNHTLNPTRWKYGFPADDWVALVYTNKKKKII